MILEMLLMLFHTSGATVKPVLVTTCIERPPLYKG